MVTLGLDVSTSTAGISFIDSNTKQIIDACFVDISKVDDNKEKAKLIIDKVATYPHKFERINLEAALSGFAGGKMKTQIIIKLARCNALIEYILSEHYGIKVQLVGAMTARKQLFGKARIKGIKPKEYVKQQLNSMFDMSRFIINNKIGNVDKRVEDTYDAIVIGFYK